MGSRWLAIAMTNGIEPLCVTLLPGTSMSLAFTRLTRLVDILSQMSMSHRSADEIVYGTGVCVSNLTNDVLRGDSLDAKAWHKLCAGLHVDIPDFVQDDMPEVKFSLGQDLDTVLCSAEGLCAIDVRSETVSNWCYWPYAKADDLYRDLSHDYGWARADVRRCLLESPYLPSPVGIPYAQLADIGDAYITNAGMACCRVPGIGYVRPWVA